MHSVVLTGGGTAGHILPNIALIPELKKLFENVVYVGGEGMEKNIVPTYGIPFYSTKTIKFDRKNLFSNIKIPFALHSATEEAMKILKEVDAGVVFSKGGYASIPTALAAKKLGIPLVIHESDYSMGIANKFEARFASRILTAFPETIGGEYVGNPIRSDIFKGSKENAVKMLNCKQNGKKCLLVFGGSSGAKFINDLVYEAIEDITKICNVIVITGEQESKIYSLNNLDKLNSIEKNSREQNSGVKKSCEQNSGEKTIEDLYTLKYAYRISDLYALADAFVIRGGAGSLAEVAALGKPAVTIPLPKGESRGDQVENAKSYAKRGIVTMLEQENANKEVFIACVKYVLSLPTKAANTESTGTNAKIASIIYEEYSKKFCPNLT